MELDFKSIQKVEKMKVAGEICSEIFAQLGKCVVEGSKPVDIDKLALELCKKNSVKPAFLGYEGYPAVINVNPNDVVVHGIPDATPFLNGDIVSIDFGIKYKDVYSDMSMPYGVGSIEAEAQRLIDTTRQATLAGIAAAVVGNRVGDIGYAMQTTVESAGFSVVKNMVGHGVGYALHEDPYVPGFGVKGTGEKLYEGQTLAIEAIVNEGSPKIEISQEDGWTSYTIDGMLSALFEHTIVVGKEPLILTRW